LPGSMDRLTYGQSCVSHLRLCIGPVRQASALVHEGRTERRDEGRKEGRKQARKEGKKERRDCALGQQVRQASALVHEGRK